MAFRKICRSFDKRVDDGRVCSCHGIGPKPSWPSVLVVCAVSTGGALWIQYDDSETLVDRSPQRTAAHCSPRVSDSGPCAEVGGVGRRKLVALGMDRRDGLPTFNVSARPG